MKLAIPVVGMMVASGVCCCCGSDYSDQFAEFEKASDAIAVPDVPDVPSMGGSVSASDLCGRWGAMGLAAPGGLSMLACTDDGSSASVVFRGSGDPASLCADVKSWASGAGWNKITEASMGGTTSVIFKKDSTNMTVGCVDMGGTTVSMTLSPG